MPHKQLILHVGFHKSGTTALQEALFKQRKELLQLNVLYPDIGRAAHHKVAWALTQRPWGWKNRGGELTSYRVFSKMIRLINTSRVETIILSSEFFSELNFESIQKIKTSVKNREVKILFTIRPLAKLLSSSYQQYLKYGTAVEYVAWLHSVLDEPGVSKVNPTFWKRHMHGEVISKWCDVFGTTAVKVLVVDEKRPEFLFEEVDAMLGLPLGTLKAQETGSNRSLSLEEIALLLELNRRFPRDRDWNEYLLFIRNGYVRELTDRVPHRLGAVKLPTPEWAVKKANSIAAKSKQQIKALGVQVAGELETLDSAEIQEGEPNYPSSIDIATVASAMLGLNRKITRRIPSSWFVAEIIRRVKAKIR
jgi:hypothetical protein